MWPPYASIQGDGADVMLTLSQAIPHSLDAIRVSQHLGHAFIEAARRSAHAPESEEEELGMQIYNVAPVFTARDVVMEPSYDGMSD